jgi:hypothetical protein
MKDRRFLFSCGEGGRDRDVGAITGDEMMLWGEVMGYDGDNTGEGRLRGCSETVIGDGSLEKSETVEK